MIRVTYQKYFNDYRKNYETANFASLNGLADWMFEKVVGKYKGQIYFTDPDQNHVFEGKLKLSGSSIHTSDPEWHYYIHQIQKDGAIIYSDGRFTNGICHWNDEIKQWLRDCRERKDNPKFNFG